jgi:hypothetical protein
MISIVVNLYNMRREAARTLHSLACKYQRGISADEYEVIVVENGSSEPVGSDFVESHGCNFRYLDMGSDAQPSPVHAVNRAVRETKGEFVGIILDGARMVSPGILAAARDALRISPRAVVGTLAWHLGDEHQSISATKGYSQQTEDEILESLDWQTDGYRLFRRAAWAYSNPSGHFGLLAESCATFMGRELFDTVGGYDPAFTIPGGGYTNLDFFKRCCAADGAKLIVLAGEGSFHQYHGGATTGLSAGDYGIHAAAEYRSIRGCAYEPPEISPRFFGALDFQVLPWLRRSIEATLRLG